MTIPSSPDLGALLERVRRDTAGWKKGGPSAFNSIQSLFQLILQNTVMANDGSVRFARGPRRGRQVLGGWGGPTDPVPLTNGNYLRVMLDCYIDLDDPRGPFVKINESSFQYQLDREGLRWVFRYEYQRNPQNLHPAAHLHIRGDLTESGVLPPDRALEKLHFATHRVGIEAVVRVLIEQFSVPARTEPSLWRPVLAASEQAFLEVAHAVPSGPDQ